MKSLRILLPVFVILTMLSSCMDDNELTPRYEAVVSIKTDYVGTGKYFLSDDGYEFHPTNPNFDLTGETADRAFIYFQLSDGSSMTPEKKIYSVSLLTYSPMKTKSILEKPVEESAADTLKNNALVTMSPVGLNSRYLTTYAVFYCKSKAYVDMVKEKVSKDTLYLKMNLNCDEGSTQYYSYNSFAMPSRYELIEDGITPKNDSIVVSIYGNAESDMKQYYGKYKLDY